MREQTERKKNLVLVGPMGCGKTTVGRLIADRLRWEFIDTDRLIEETTGYSITALFAEKGEAYFRYVEKELISRLTRKKQTVVATGGGAVLEEENRRVLRSIGLVFYLKTSAGVLAGRVGQGEGRPLLMGKNPTTILAELLATREVYYRQADAVVMTDGQTPGQVATEIIALAVQAGIGIPVSGRAEPKGGQT